MFIFRGELIDYNLIKSNSGNKNCILFLHGWGGNKNSFISTINLLKSKYDCLSLTLPTTAPTNLAWDMIDYVNCVAALTKSLNISTVSIVCHSFGFRIATIMNYLSQSKDFDNYLQIEKIVVTGGAGAKKFNIFKKIDLNNNICLLKQKKYKFLYQNLASRDYKELVPTNKITFKNVVNFNTFRMLKFNIPILIFWGINDKETPIWIAKKIFKNNKKNALFYKTKSDHFAYLKQSAYFNNLVVKFL